MRMMIEPTAAYCAAKFATEEQLSKIKVASHEIEKSILEGRSRLKSEQDFHNAIAEASQNPFVKELMPIINRAIHSVVTTFDKNPDLLTLSMNDHRELVRFLETRNADGAYAAMRLHIVHAFEISRIELDMP